LSSATKSVDDEEVPNRVEKKDRAVAVFLRLGAKHMVRARTEESSGGGVWVASTRTTFRRSLLSSGSSFSGLTGREA
jgi:hypothetical protein